MKTINIQPITRIGGHAKAVIELDHNGSIEDAKFSISSYRGFEKFCEGRPAEEMPRIVVHISGICPYAHHMASSKAADALFGVVPPPTAVKIRRLMQAIAYHSDKVLHFYFLALPDFVMEDAHYSKRNIVGIAEKMPDIAKRAIHIRYLGAKMLESVAGRAVHPTFSLPGGVSKPITESERKELLSGAKELLEFSTFSLKFAKENIFLKYEEEIKTLGVIKVGYIGTVSEDGALDFYDGKVRLMKPDGGYEEFSCEKYTDYISEKVMPWSYQKFPYAKGWGDFSMDLENPSGIYRSNALARINVCDKMKTPLAQKELEEFRSKFGRPAHYTLLYHYARLIEMLQNAEEAVEILEDPEITSKDVRVEIEPKAGRGVGCVEAPRGTLFHDYECDNGGIVKNINIISGTTHNAAAINMSLKQAASMLIKEGKYDQQTLNKLEMVIRSYDP